MDADERKLLRRLYMTPKLQYIMSPQKVPVTEISRIWHEKKGDGYAEHTLHGVAAEEGWKAARTKHQAELEEQSAKAQLAATGETAAMVVERYSAILNKQIIGITDFLKRQPMEFNTSDKAIAALCKVIELDHKVRGLDSINMTLADVSPGWIKLFEKFGIRTPDNGHDKTHDGSEHAPEMQN